MNEEKLVSVIIPTYKRSKRLSQAIKSVLKQTYKNIEIIVVDDNDPFSEHRLKTEDLMSEFVDNPKIKYIKHSKNKNGAAARNTGIRISNGAYISFLDDDDMYLSEKIEKQVRYLETHIKHGGVYCGRIQNGKQIIGGIEGDLTKDIILLSFTPTTPALMFRSEKVKILEGFDENFKRHQDFEFLLRYFEIDTLGVVPEALVMIGQNEGENELHGEILEQTKETFLNEFNDKIEELSKNNKYFKKRVYSVHYAPVVFDHLSQKYLRKAISIYLKGVKLSFLIFHITMFKYFIKYLKHFLLIKRTK
jgi:glycosyltransferase involved in cell wall biosynthesis